MPTSESAPREMIIVADDGGFHRAVNRGILKAVGRGALTHVDVMQGYPHADELIKALARYPEIGLGVHIFIYSEDNLRNLLRVSWWRLLADESFRKHLLQSTEKQIKLFQDTIGENPTHVSTHGHLHLTYDDLPHLWFVEQVVRLTEGGPPVIIRGDQTKPIRHTRLREAILGRKPLTPEQFCTYIQNLSSDPDALVELVVHPAENSSEDGYLPSPLGASKRQQDLDALIEIIDKDAIGKANFSLVYPKSKQALQENDQ